MESAVDRSGCRECVTYNPLRILGPGLKPLISFMLTRWHPLCRFCTLNECAVPGMPGTDRRRTNMRASTAALRQILLGCLLMGICAPGWARFEPVSCKNSFTEQQEIAGGAKLAAQVF